jgi:hypothetical protein
VRSALAPRPRHTRSGDLVLGSLAAIVAIAFLARLGIQASHALFASDECFHAYVAQWILEHRRFPTVLPEFYSGLYYYYQPLFHVIGAAWAAALGAAALRFLPVFLTGAALALLLVAPGVPLAARRWAVLLCVSNLIVTQNAVRLYVEPLTTAVFVACVIALLAWHRSPGTGRAAIAGIVAGLGLLTKFHAWWWVGFLAIVAIGHAVAGRRTHAAQLGLAVAIALAVAAPWLVRNQILFGSALYPAMAPDMDRTLYALNVRHFTTPPLEFLLETPRSMGPALMLAIVAALGVAAAARRRGLPEALLAFGVLAMAGTAFTPMTAARHLGPFMPITALAAAWVVAPVLASRATLAIVLEAAMLLTASVSVVTMPDVRGPIDLQPHLAEAFHRVVASTPPGSRVLSLWTYDTFYYTRRPATWPNPWGQRVHPVALFQESDPSRFAEELHRYDIDYVLVPLHIRREAFNSANYPASFLNCVLALTRQGRMRIVWQSDRIALLQSPRSP